MLVFCSKGSGQVSEMLSLLEMSGVETNMYDKTSYVILVTGDEHLKTVLSSVRIVRQK